jgi:hypothetical protein
VTPAACALPAHSRPRAASNHRRQDRDSKARQLLPQALPRLRSRRYPPSCPRPTRLVRPIRTTRLVQACAIATASRHDRDATPRKKRAVGVAGGACECSSEGWTRRGIAGASSPGVLIVCAMRASVLSSPIRWPATAGTTCTRCSYSLTGVVPRSWQPGSSALSRTSARRARESHVGCFARLNGSVGVVRLDLIGGVDGPDGG